MKKHREEDGFARMHALQGLKRSCKDLSLLICSLLPLPPFLLSSTTLPALFSSLWFEIAMLLSLALLDVFFYIFKSVSIKPVSIYQCISII